MELYATRDLRVTKMKRNLDRTLKFKTAFVLNGATLVGLLAGAGLPRA
jgi:hypothetical protein